MQVHCTWTCPLRFKLFSFSKHLGRNIRGCRKESCNLYASLVATMSTGSTENAAVTSQNEATQKTHHPVQVRVTITHFDFCFFFFFHNISWNEMLFSHFVIWPRFCYLKFLLCMCLWVGPFCVIWFKALFIFFGSSIWILAGWIVIWIIICFVDWYYFGWFYLEFVFSGWLDWNLVQVNCIDMHTLMRMNNSLTGELES